MVVKQACASDNVNRRSGTIAEFRGQYRKVVGRDFVPEFDSWETPAETLSTPRSPNNSQNTHPPSKPSPRSFIGKYIVQLETTSPGDSITTQELRNRLLGNSKEIILRCNSTYQNMPSTKSRLTNTIVGPFGKSLDKPLCYCIARDKRCDKLANTLYEEAFSAYLNTPDDYDLVLGDLLPKDFRAHARRLLAERKYHEGTHLQAVEDWPVFQARLKAQSGHATIGFPTGIDRLDEATSGLCGLVLLGGPPGIGKSALAVQFAMEALASMQDVGVLIYSLDMPKHAYFSRMWSREAGVPIARLTKPQNEDEANRIEAADERLKPLLGRLRIIEAEMLVRESQGETADGTILSRSRMEEALNKHMQELKNVTGASRGMIIVDHFQRLAVPAHIGTGSEADNWRLEVLRRAQRRTQRAQNHLGDPFIVISEVRKEAGDRNLQVRDLLGSAELAYAADMVLLMEEGRDRSQPPGVAPLLLRIAKVRDLGERVEIDLRFHHRVTRFEVVDALAGQDRSSHQAAGGGGRGGARKINRRGE